MPDFNARLQASLPMLRRVALRLAGPNDADDLAQEAVRRCLDHRDRIRDTATLPGLAATILRNHHFTRLKRAAYAREQLARYPRPDHVAADQEARCRLNDALLLIDRLVPDQRDALLAVVANDEPYDVVAARHNCPVGTIKSRVARARLALSAC